MIEPVHKQLMQPLTQKIRTLSITEAARHPAWTKIGGEVFWAVSDAVISPVQWAMEENVK